MTSHQDYLFCSERLGFRTWLDKDLEPFARLNADPEVMEFFPAIRSFNETAVFVEKIKEYFNTNGYGVYAVDALHNEDFIGFIGFMNPRFEAWFTPCTEIGWRLKKEAWGFGYATEGARKVLDYGFEKFSFPEIYSFTTTSNSRSEKVMQKSGMQKVGYFEHPLLEEGHFLRPHVLYNLKNPLLLA